MADVRPAAGSAMRGLNRAVSKTPFGRRLDARIGNRRQWLDHWHETRTLGGSAEVVEGLRATVPGAPDEPLLLFSATWRAGSTLVQRLLMSGGDTLLWGEPWYRSDLVPRLRESLVPVTDGWPRPGTIIDELDADDGPLTERWVANLHPAHDDLVEAHRDLFRRLLGESATRRGYARWGAKFVRLGIDDADYLHLLFPRARMVFVYRHPAASWASYRARKFRAYVRYPSEPVISADRFGRLWRERVEGFLAAQHRLGILVVPYHELCDDPRATVARLGAHVGAELDAGVLDERIGGTARSVEPYVLSAAEHAAIRRRTGALVERLGIPAET